MSAEQGPLLARALERIRRSPGAIWAVSGPVNSGKSQFLAGFLDFVARHSPEWSVGGVLNRGLYTGGTKAAYEGMDCLTKQRFLFAVRAGLSAGQHRVLRPYEPWDTDGAVTIGPWLILQSGLIAAESAVHRALTQGCQLIVVDEFGPLECRGQGLRMAADAVVQAQRSLLLVVREPLVETVRAMYGPLTVIDVPCHAGS
jgi:nucleoside-triphosphatase THEP1